jgi:phenylpropionate dioxygenase-like ring-hydroxylating dioxygenase large terminal subunit
MSYLLDCWYMAAWTQELDRPGGGGLVARTVCDVPLVLFRAQDGIAALLDKCPHRFAPLSRGRLVEETVQCAYHGLAFGHRGECARNPHGAIVDALRVRSFPTVEKYHAVWVWIGAPERADVALLPQLTFLDVEKERVANRGGYIHAAANYLLYVDNIMDLTHVNFLHAASVGSDWITHATRQIEEDERSLTVSWSSQGQSPAPFELKLGLFDAAVRLERRTEVQWFLPSAMRLTQLASAQGSAPFTRSSAHVMTPETEKTVHYFYAATRDTDMDNGAFDDRLAQERDRIIRAEDNPMVEAVQARMGTADVFSLKPALLRTDEPSVRARRKLDLLIMGAAALN